MNIACMVAKFGIGLANRALEKFKIHLILNTCNKNVVFLGVIYKGEKVLDIKAYL